MRCLTIRQPWATLIALGEKSFETRSWRTAYRGEIAIHAGLRVDKAVCGQEPFRSALARHGLTADDLPTGAIIAAASLIHCHEITAGLAEEGWPHGNEYIFGDYREGRFAWELTGVAPLEHTFRLRAGSVCGSTLFSRRSIEPLMENQIGKLQEVLFQSWSIGSSSKWTASNPAAGQCGVTALVVQDMLGGEIMKTPLPAGWHFYNRIDGGVCDFTGSQFNEPILYADMPATREEAFDDTNEQQYRCLREKVYSLWDEME